MRRMVPRQLNFAFADSPKGGGSDACSDVSEQRAFLLQKAKRKRTARTVACAVDSGRLLEEVASEENLSRALLNVIRNKGAPGPDGGAGTSVCAARCSRNAIERARSAGSSFRRPEAGNAGLPFVYKFILLHAYACLGV